MRRLLHSYHRPIMRLILFSCYALLTSSLIHAATPINGWYSSVLGGYAYIPSNLNKIYGAYHYADPIYNPGYVAGGNLGYKSNPLRYEFEISYFNATLNHFSQNNIRQNEAGGYQNGITGMANAYYDFPGLLSCLEPFLGFGIGYAWLHDQLQSFSTVSPSSVTISTSAFAYQAMAGVTYNFAENYALELHYRYLATPSLFDFGHVFQSNFVQLGITYRFDYARYQ